MNDNDIMELQRAFTGADVMIVKDRYAKQLASRFDYVKNSGDARNIALDRIKTGNGSKLAVMFLPRGSYRKFALLTLSSGLIPSDMDTIVMSLYTHLTKRRARLLRESGAKIVYCTDPSFDEIAMIKAKDIIINTRDGKWRSCLNGKQVEAPRITSFEYNRIKNYRTSDIACYIGYGDETMKSCIIQGNAMKLRFKISKMLGRKFESPRTYSRSVILFGGTGLKNVLRNLSLGRYSEAISDNALSLLFPKRTKETNMFDIANDNTMLIPQSGPAYDFLFGDYSAETKYDEIAEDVTDLAYSLNKVWLHYAGYANIRLNETLTPTTPLKISQGIADLIGASKMIDAVISGVPIEDLLDD